MTESPEQPDQNAKPKNSSVPTASALVTIVNSDGIHMRPALKIVELTQKFECDVRFVQKSYMKIDGVDVAYGEHNAIDGKSIMQLTMLSMTQGAEVTVECEGDDAENALAAIVELIESGFDEF